MSCNTISIIACVITLNLYIVLFLKPKYSNLMRRTSLVLAACMAGSDLVLHVSLTCSNLAGYGDLPPGFACAFVGGWLFATPSILSIFYSCCIAMNSQIALVLKRTPHRYALRYYVPVPILGTFIFTFSALGTRSYGYDETWGYCWYSTENVPASLTLVRILLTYSIPTLICMLYLLVASITIWVSVFGTYSNTLPFSQQSNETSIERHNGKRRASYAKEAFPSAKLAKSHNYVESPMQDRLSASSGFASSTVSPPPRASFAKPSYSIARVLLPARSTDAAGSATVDIESNYSQQRNISDMGNQNGNYRGTQRRNAVLRQLTIRLIGYNLTPILCLLPGIILDLVTKINPSIQVPSWLNGLFDGLNGLVGLFNSALMLSDPALLVVWKDAQSSARRSLTDLVRSLLGLGPEPAAYEMEAKRPRRWDKGEDALSTMFGVEARTRLDVEQEFEEPDDTNKRSTNQHPSVNDERSTLLDDKLDPSPISPSSGHPSPIGDVSYKTVTHEGRGWRAMGFSSSPQEMQIQVQVNVARVSRRISRVDLMEDWLSGL
ncbi:hypothetical protein CPB86DRAFT_304101 [Serendipita vermifera]|nr:hypothetical protein CPB86DRAFT_304101 [Serendipita vermifera]